MLKNQEVGLDPNFHYRGKNQTRIETFSDAVFALAITLLVLSSSVPTSFSDLRTSLTDIVPFGLCVVLITIIWYQHYIFFLRYGLQDLKIVVANTLLLFLILVYVYPLKFLMKFLTILYSALFRGDWSYFQTTYGDMGRSDMQFLMIVYGLGAALIFLTLSWMYRHALKLRAELELDEYEIYASKVSMRMNLIQCGVPLLSVLVAVFFGRSNGGMTVAGFIYFLFPIVMPLYGVRSGKKGKKILEKMKQ